MLPTVQVLLDDGTGTFPYDITSKCLLADGFRFDRGRQDWQGGVTAGSLSLTLNNADGRFTPGSTIIASPSPIKVDRRIRLKETINGVTYTRFTGYVKQWPVSWPAVVSTWSTVQLVATDAQARAERRVLRSVVEEEILVDSPSAYYTLGEPAGATSAGDTSGGQAAALPMAGSSGTAVVFGTATGPSTDGLTGAQFAAGQYLAGGPSALSASFVAEVFFTVSAASQSLVSEAGGADILAVNGSGYLASRLGLASSTNVTDGLVHHAAVRVESGVGATLWLDGVQVATSGSTFAVTSSLLVGAGQYNFNAMTGVQSSMTGSLAHFALFGSAIATARITAHATAGSTGFAGESGTARITRLAGYASLPLGTLDSSLTSVPFVDLTGRSAWDALQQVTDAEMGVSFVDGSGNLIFHNRNRSPAKTTPDLTLAATYVTPDVQPVDDDQQIVNYFETTAEGTGNGAQVVRNTTSESTHGRYSGSASYLVSTDQEALDRANWTVALFAEPTTRYGTLTINLAGMTAAQAATVLTAVEINCWLRITGAPTQNTGGTQVDVVVEGYTETQSESEWKLTCNVVSQSLFRAWVLDSTTLSVLDSTTRLYV